MELKYDPSIKGITGDGTFTNMTSIILLGLHVMSCILVMFLMLLNIARIFSKT